MASLLGFGEQIVHSSPLAELERERCLAGVAEAWTRKVIAEACFSYSL